MKSTNKTYETHVYLGTVNGKKITKHIRAKSQKELNQKVLELKYSKHLGKDLLSNSTFGYWSNRWFEVISTTAKPDGKPRAKTSINCYHNAVNRLNEYLNDIELKDITRDYFQHVIIDLSSKPLRSNGYYGKASIKKIIVTAQMIFDYARENNQIVNYINFKKISIPIQCQQNKRRAISFEEQQMIIDTPHRCQPVAMILLFSGLRRGELAALTWEDINLDKGYIFVNKSLLMDVNPPVLKEGGKSKSATRIVPIPPILVDYLKEYKKTSKTDLVVTNAKGKMFNDQSYRRLWDSYMCDLNIKYGYPGKNVNKHSPTPIPMVINPFTSHCLRHTYATNLFLQGIHVDEAKQYLGHADITTTSNIYVDLMHFNKVTLEDEYKNALDSYYKISVA